MPEITWTNCAEQMPPDDGTRIILKINGKIYQAISMDLWNKRDLYGLKARAVYWTEFTEEKWKELNK